MVKAIFLDIDGTLRDERQGVPASAARAIGICRETGIRIVICTGRNMASIQPDVGRLEVDAIIAGGGCLIMDEGVVKKDSCFRYEEIKSILDDLARHKVPYALENQERIFMNQAACLWFQKDFEEKLRGLDHTEKARRRLENGICYRDTMGEYRPDSDRIHKICIWSPPRMALEMADKAGRAGTIVQQGERDGWWYLETLPPGCTKGTAIREWCGLYDINPKDTMSFGDGKNDIDMLLATGVGVAMEDGDEELKACAASICGTAMEDGIYRELVRRNIIRRRKRE